MTATIAPALTVRQRRVLEFLRRFHQQHGYAPSIREVQEAAGLESPSSAHYQLRELERMGWIRRAPGLARAISVLNPEDGTDS